MADIDSEQLREAIQELNNTLNGLGAAATGSRGKFVEAGDALFKVKGSGAAAANALEQMGRSLVKLTGQIYKGEQGTKKYAEAVDDIATAIGTLTFLIGGPLVKAITVATLGLFKYGKAASEMGDQLFKSYQSLSRSGAAAADGLQGMFQLMQDFRLSLDDLPQLSSVIQENAEALAMFRGSVYEGARSMGDIRRNITKSGLERELMGLGMTTQEINETLGGFINIYTNLGLLQNKSTKEATTALKGYVTEIDAVTKLTGANRKQQEAAMMEAMAIEQFNVKIQELTEQGREKEAKSLLQTYNILRQFNPEMAKGFAQMTTGFIGPNSVGSYLASNADAYRAATQEGLTAAQRIQMMGEGMREFSGPNGIGRTMAMVGKLNEITGMQVQSMFKSGVITDEFVKKFDAATTEAEKQRLLQEAGIKTMVDTQQADLNSMQSMQKFVSHGVGPATSALASLAGVVESLTSMLPGKRATAGLAGATAGAATGAAIGSMFGPVGTAVGAGIGGLAGGVTGLIAGGGPSKVATEAGMINPNDVFEFGGNTGDLAHFQQLDTNVQQRALMLAADYLRMTGKKLRLNSAFRSLAEQASVQATGGAPKAAPGSSLHERGRALDFNRDQVAFMEQQGLLSKYGFRSGASFNDPQHVQALQMGGPAFRGRSYLVGERGPELFSPGESGSVTSNDSLQRAMGAGLDQQVNLARTQVSISERMVSILERQTQTLNRILQVQQA